MTDWGSWSREAVALMQARNAEWPDAYGIGGAPYRWDLEQASIVFTRQTSRVVADLCLAGVVVDGDERFTWGWASQGAPHAATCALSSVQQFGVEHDLPLLTSPSLPGGHAQGLEATCIAGRILDADGVFVAHDDGARLYFTLHNFRTEGS